MYRSLSVHFICLLDLCWSLSDSFKRRTYSDCKTSACLSQMIMAQLEPVIRQIWLRSSSLMYLDFFLLGPSITLCSQLNNFGSSANFPIMSQLPDQGPMAPQNPNNGFSPRWKWEPISSLWFVLIQEALSLSHASLMALAALAVAKLLWTPHRWHTFNHLLHHIHWLLQRMWMH